MVQTRSKARASGGTDLYKLFRLCARGPKLHRMPCLFITLDQSIKFKGKKAEQYAEKHSALLLVGNLDSERAEIHSLAEEIRNQPRRGKSGNTVIVYYDWAYARAWAKLIAHPRYTASDFPLSRRSNKETLPSLSAHYDCSLINNPFTKHISKSQ